MTRAELSALADRHEARAVKLAGSSYCFDRTISEMSTLIVTTVQAHFAIAAALRLTTPDAQMETS